MVEYDSLSQLLSSLPPKERSVGRKGHGSGQSEWVLAGEVPGKRARVPGW